MSDPHASPNVDLSLVDPSVDADEIDLALNGVPTIFPVVTASDDLDHGLETVNLVTVPHRTIPEALANLRQRRINHVPIPGGAGLCLYHIREDAWNVDAVWPTAQVAGEHGAPIHRYKSFADAPRGMTLIFVNNHVWHITVSLGGGLNDTSDYHQLGYSGAATIANTYTWCGAHDWYGIETVNLVDVWPDPAKPKPQPKPWGIAERERQVHADLVRARKNGAPKRKIDGLKAWDQRILARMKELKIKRIPL